MMPADKIETHCEEAGSGAIGVCGSCMDARGIAEAELVDGCRRSTMEELTDWAQWADEAVAF